MHLFSSHPGSQGQSTHLFTRTHLQPHHQTIIIPIPQLPGGGLEEVAGGMDCRGLSRVIVFNIVEYAFEFQKLHQRDSVITRLETPPLTLLSISRS